MECSILFHVLLFAILNQHCQKRSWPRITQTGLLQLWDATVSKPYHTLCIRSPIVMHSLIFSLQSISSSAVYLHYGSFYSKTHLNHLKEVCQSRILMRKTSVNKSGFCHGGVYVSELCSYSDSSKLAAVVVPAASLNTDNGITSITTTATVTHKAYVAFFTVLSKCTSFCQDKKSVCNKLCDSILFFALLYPLFLVFQKWFF